MKFIEKAQQEFWKTKSVLMSAEAAASGWDLRVVDPQMMAGGDTVSLYVWDRPTNWVWTCSIDRTQFHKAAEKASGSGRKIVDSIRGDLAYAVAQAAAGTPMSRRDGLGWEEELALLLSAYAGTTKTYRATDGFKNGGSFIVLNYRTGLIAEGILRPVAMPLRSPEEKNALLPFETLQNTIKEVVNLDLMNHPEWFENGFVPPKP